ncbi:MAG TPA: glycoside hydrolase family 6 protein [Streptosporangiaceae bacterium]|nr:glycoside hydrolase family 6 protein [Streptosporangiaceae bacterium]
MEVSKLGHGPQARVTIRQVAELAGVSIATVSRVVNGHPDVSGATRETVQRVLRERGYTTSGRPRPTPTGLVGVTMPVVHPGYSAEILSGAAEALYEHDMRVVLCPTRHSHARELSLLDGLVQGETDGAIIVLPEESSAELQALAGQGLRFVIVDPRTDVAEGLPVVCAAHSSGATQATRHLLELGHRRIGAIAGPAGWMATEERLRGHHADCIAMVADASNASYNNPAGCGSQYYPATQSDFSTWNLTTQWYAQNIGNAVASTHFVIDTSRNSDGPNNMQKYANPPYNQPASDISVLASGNWCNPPASGLGLRPTANTGVPLLDAYLWVKTPGQSDGQCDAAGGVRAWDYSLYTQPGWPVAASAQALFDPLWGTDDPAAGAWFSAQALQLAQLASPALPRA